MRSVERDEDGKVEAIDALIYLDGMTYHYADLHFNNKYLWLTLSNKVFYDFLTTDGKEKYSMLGVLINLIGMLNLRINNYTWVEVCVDANLNQRKKLLSALKSPDYIPIVNGKAYTTEEGKNGIKGYLKIFQGTRFGVIQNPTLYFKNADESLVVTVYDKGREIKEKGQKDYIREWDEIKTGCLYRLEVRCKGDYIKAFCQSRKIDYYEFLYMLSTPSFRIELLEWLTDKIIYFNTVDAYGKKRQNKLTAFDACFLT